MIHFFRLTFFIFFLFSNTIEAKTINDVIKIEGKFYIITPSPSQFYSRANNTYCKSGIIYRGEYELKNDKLIFVKMLGVSDSISKSDLSFLELPLSGQHIKSNEKYYLNKVDDIDKVRKVLKHRPFECSNWGGNNTSSVEFFEGEIKRTFYLLDRTEPYTEYGELSYFRNYQDESLVYVVRLKDSLDVNVFDLHDKYGNQPAYMYGARHRYLSYAVNNQGQHCKLPAGEYVLRREKDNIIEYSDTCEVIVGNRTEINFKIVNPKPMPIKVDTVRLVALKFEGIGLDFDYGNNQIGNVRQHELNMFGFGLYSTKQKFIGVRNQMSVIGAIGGRYAYGVIHPDSSVIGLDDFKLQNYSYLSLLLKGSARLYLTKYKRKQQSRLFIEAGLACNLPVVFRYVARHKGDKYSSKWVHQFSDVSVFGKIGLHKGMSVIAGFRPFNVLKDPYPQLSKFTIGFSYSVYL